jgi:putative IMPACT (imprinted ancient) family translation regulator
MSTDDYRTLAEPGSAQTRVLGSRFLSRALPASVFDDLLPVLDEEKKLHHDATHWCWAVRLGVGSDVVEKSSDAGEPRGTAGLPILREIQKRELTGCFVMVTRYFGGTKLGRGNLARAYGECAALALDAAPHVVRKILKCCRVRCSFDDQAIVYHLAQRFQAVVEPVAAAGHAEFLLRMSPAVWLALRTALNEESRGRISVEGDS